MAEDDNEIEIVGGRHAVHVDSPPTSFREDEARVVEVRTHYPESASMEREPEMVHIPERREPEPRMMEPERKPIVAEEYFGNRYTMRQPVGRSQMSGIIASAQNAPPYGRNARFMHPAKPAQAAVPKVQTYGSSGQFDKLVESAQNAPPYGRFAKARNPGFTEANIQRIPLGKNAPKFDQLKSAVRNRVDHMKYVIGEDFAARKREKTLYKKTYREARLGLIRGDFVGTDDSGKAIFRGGIAEEKARADMQKKYGITPPGQQKKTTEWGKLLSQGAPVFAGYRRGYGRRPRVQRLAARDRKLMQDIRRKTNRMSVPAASHERERNGFGKEMRHPLAGLTESHQPMSGFGNVKNHPFGNLTTPGHGMSIGAMRNPMAGFGKRRKK